jgi:hypothetical protein
MSVWGFGVQLRPIDIDIDHFQLSQCTMDGDGGWATKGRSRFEVELAKALNE